MGWDILGQEWAANLLQQHIASGQVRHAYLLTGPDGVGRRSLALRFAQALNCIQPPEPGQPCGACRPCLQIARMQHPDLAVVRSEPDSNSIKVEQIRDLQPGLNLMPYEARYRVALLLDFEQATASAQNALLKTLEEAPERVILLLTADMPENLLPTIVSRCEVMRLRPMALEALAAALTQRLEIEAGPARLLAHLSGGCPGSALALHADPAALGQYRAWLDGLYAVLGAGRIERFRLAETIVKDKEKLRPILRAWLLYWRDVMLLASGAAAALTHLDREDELRALAAQLTFSQAHACVAAVEGALNDLDANLNTRLLCEVLLLDLPTLRTAQPQPTG